MQFPEGFTIFAHYLKLWKDNMEDFIVSARKYRPATFDTVVGQKALIVTLKNAILTGKLAHAYLFCGPRGVGKTTSARIFAKSINCEHLTPEGEACNECESCRAFNEQRSLNIHELDAASNNSVDDIRELIDQVRIPPQIGRYKVFIIDEVHMLSIGAFNALLKTLEEPPAHVLFILATTEVHKLPSTILSRCQRFDFKRIPPEAIAERLKEVATKENLQISDDGAMLIARIADGAMRDALSLLDRCSSYEGVIDSSVVANSAGLAGREHIFELCDCILEKDAAKALEVVNKLYNDSCDMERLITELTSHFRNLMVSKAVKNFQDMIICSQGEIEIIRQQSAKTTLATIMSCIDVLTASASTMKQGANRRTSAELCIIRLCTPSLDGDMNAILRRLSELESAVASGKIVVKSETPAPAKPEAKPEKIEESPVPVAEVKKEPEKEEIPLPQSPPASQEETVVPKNMGTVPFNSWPEVLEKLFSLDKSLIAMLTGSSAFIHQDKYLLIKGSPLLEMCLKTGDYSKTIKAAVTEITGRTYTLAVYNNKQEEAPKNPLSDLVSKAKGLGVKIEEE